MKQDSFYTPDRIVDAALRKCTLTSPASIVDFAAGDGALLRKATASWPKASIYATDVDFNAIRSIRREFPDWAVSRCDFLSPMSRSRATVFSRLAQPADLILLNPPFSYRGAQTFPVSVWDESFLCSKAMAFVLQSLHYLAHNGQLIAVLPESSLFSDKDAHAWDAIKNRFTLTTGATAKRGVFSGCHARCTIVRLIGRKRKRSVGAVNAIRPNQPLAVTLIRGSVPLHMDTGSDRTLVHSTDLQRSSVILNGHVASAVRPSIIGPSVLIPRVGAPSVEKVAIYRRNKRVVLSDCVIGLQCESSSDADALHQLIVSDETRYRRLYAGTCAPYTTVKRIVEFLSQLGCAVSVKKSR